jgi:hypothetical protein
VLFNDSGVANGDAGLVYNKTTDALSVGGALGVTGAATLASTLAVTGATTLTGATTIQGLKAGKGNGAYASNTAFGSGCLAAVTADSGLLALGSGCMPIVTSGSFNVGAGNRCLEALTLGSSNTAVGTLSLATISTQDENTAIGRGALIYSVGGQNTAIGYSAGGNHLVGSNNAFFGANAQPSATTISNEYTYGGGAVVNHRFPNGNLVVGNGRIDVGGASAALRITSSPGDMYQTVASKQALGGVTSITVVFTTSNAVVNTVIVDAQLVGYQAFADFCLGKYGSQPTIVLRTNATAGITSTLVLAGSIFTFTITIASPTTINLPILNLNVSVGGGLSSPPTFTVLPVVTFI